jgi:hypothetical protein
MKEMREKVVASTVLALNIVNDALGRIAAIFKGEGGGIRIHKVSTRFYTY